MVLDRFNAIHLKKTFFFSVVTMMYLNFFMPFSHLKLNFYAKDTGKIWEKATEIHTKYSVVIVVVVKRIRKD